MKTGPRMAPFSFRLYEAIEVQPSFRAPFSAADGDPIERLEATRLPPRAVHARRLLHLYLRGPRA